MSSELSELNKPKPPEELKYLISNSRCLCYLMSLRCALVSTRSIKVQETLMVVSVEFWSRLKIPRCIGISIIDKLEKISLSCYRNTALTPLKRPGVAALFTCTHSTMKQSSIGVTILSSLTTFWLNSMGSWTWLMLPFMQLELVWMTSGYGTIPTKDLPTHSTRPDNWAWLCIYGLSRTTCFNLEPRTTLKCTASDTTQSSWTESSHNSQISMLPWLRSGSGIQSISW